MCVIGTDKNEIPLYGQEMNRLETFCDTMDAHLNSPTTFEHLLRLNQLNNQTFLLNGFFHAVSNSINSIQLGSTLFRHYIKDLNDLINSLDMEHERLPADFQKDFSRILAKVPQVIDGINDSALRLDSFVTPLSELTGQALHTAGSTVDINHLISLCSSMSHYQIANFTNHFRLDLDSTPVLSRGSARQISQVIMNLLTNALFALSDRSCEVVISTACDQSSGSVEMSIRDEGIGISTDIFPRIVEPFFTTWQEHSCLGLGLTVADHIVRNHGGKMSVCSEQNKGTNVRVLLPLCRPIQPERAND